jgi:hypothetical protein
VNYQRNTGFVLRVIGSHSILVPVGSPPEGALTLVLDGPVALSLWEALAESASAAQLAAGVVAEFEVDRQVAEGDVETFLQQLLALGCVSIA